MASGATATADSPSPAAEVNHTGSPLFSVQEIAASLTDQQVPDRFLLKDTNLPLTNSTIGGDGIIGRNSDTPPWLTDLMIDFSLLSSTSTDSSAASEEIRKFRSAICSWGCFLVKNHGIEKEQLDQVLQVSRQFFALPPEEKSKYVVNEPFNGYGNETTLAGNVTMNWNDRLFLRDCAADPTNIRYWPDNPPLLRKVHSNFTNKVKEMPNILLRAIATSMDLDENCFLSQHGEEGTLTGRLNIYPACPNPERVMGFREHSDGATFAVILQDIAGLEVMKDARWHQVPVVQGALCILIGDIIEIMSNGLIKSVLHRVVTNPKADRISSTLFYAPCSEIEISPVDELVNADRPRGYKVTTIIKYAQAYLHCNPLGKRTLDAFKM